MKTKDCGLVAAGVLIGTAGIKALTSSDAKKFYTHCAALTLRVKDDIMKTVSKVRENCDDIVSDAKDINEKFAEETDAAIEDAAIEDAAAGAAAGE